MADFPRAPVARILEEAAFFALDAVRLVVSDASGAILMADGSWKRPPEETVVADSGLLLPRDTIEAIAVAIQEWQGHASHADTEARVLREWLKVEQRRVDAALDAIKEGK